MISLSKYSEKKRVTVIKPKKQVRRFPSKKPKQRENIQMFIRRDEKDDIMIIKVGQGDE
jgi:hypothetical protein